MKNCCQDIQDMDCSVNSILQRITPIDYIDNVLVINSPATANTSVEMNGVVIGGENGVLSLPEGTTVGGVPLLSPHFINGIYVLPNKTVIDGYPILNTNYFYFYTTNNISAQTFASGCFINNNISTSSVSSTSFVANYLFLPPGDCILTSLLFSFVVGATGTSSLTNVVATIYTISLGNVVANTGITATIAACPVNSRNFAFSNFQYAISNGDRVGIRVTYTGSTTAITTPFATLGYKFL